MPSHNHVQGSGTEFPTQGYEGSTRWRHNSKQSGGKFGLTFNRGGNQAHSHGLNVANQKLLFWRRLA